MNAEQERFEQEKDLFQYGDEDAQEIGQGEILTSGIAAEIELEQIVPYLLWDLTREDK